MTLLFEIVASLAGEVSSLTAPPKGTGDAVVSLLRTLAFSNVVADRSAERHW